LNDTLLTFKPSHLTTGESELNKTVAAVATALWAVFLGVERSVEVDQPQAGGYNIGELAGVRSIISSRLSSVTKIEEAFAVACASTLLPLA
jgi:hypothetical protein